MAKKTDKQDKTPKEKKANFDKALKGFLKLKGQNKPPAKKN